MPSQNVHETREERLRGVGRERPVERRSSALTAVAEEREVRHREHGAPDVGERGVHLPRRVGEESQAGELPCHPRELALAVAGRESDEEKQPASDRGDRLARDQHARRPDALDDDPHPSSVVVCRASGGTLGARR